ncbi:amidohydrolase family protein [Streptomyces sp. NPDC050625]|uniref:amidohydrolase family protein n=1 Tax=Streptomyces sp. NPDC050625 TaxID=3154629 RepID=UPI0034423217
MSQVIDVHTHYVPRGWPALSDKDDVPWLRIDSEREATIMVGSKEFRRIADDCWDARVRLADMGGDSVDVQVVSPTPVFFSYDRTPAEGMKIAKIFNDVALEICDPARHRLVPFCQVPLQDPELACEELDRCLAAGHRGVEIGNHVGDRDLDDSGIVMFLQHCAQVGAPVFVHPWDMPTSPRLNRWMSQWLTGMPAETHLSLLAMILGGVFDRLPETLKICFAHGGGSFAFWLGRLENAWYERQDLVGVSEKPPSQYTGRFSVDSVVFNPASLRLLVDVVGVENIMLGSDYPYPLGERPVGQVVRQAEFLSDTDKERLLGGNAESFLSLPARQEV